MLREEDKFGYLIERNDLGKSPHYLAVYHYRLEWTANAHDAIRFAREKDAYAFKKLTQKTNPEAWFRQVTVTAHPVEHCFEPTQPEE